MRTLCLAAALLVLWNPAAGAQSDLDAFMQRVLARRDDNWQKLQQYVLDEHEAIELRGPDRNVMWGEQRDFTWFLREGRFVRSPLRFNGVAIGEADRRKYEDDFVRREQEREKRRAERAKEPEPQFITSAYFLRFEFEPGKYALVGREPLDGQEVLRLEYYPSQLFREQRSDRDRQADRDRRRDRQQPMEEEVRRLMNKAGVVTLWIDPASHQILKYTFDNVGSALSGIPIQIDALPIGWLARVDELRASMTMGQPFPGVWLPRSLEMAFAITLATGQVNMRYALDYHDYRRADVTSTIQVPDLRE